MKKISFRDLTHDFVENLEAKDEIFSTKNVYVEIAPKNIGSGRRGFWFYGSNNGIVVDVSVLDKPEVIKPQQGDRVDITYIPVIDRFNDRENIRLMTKTIDVR